MEDKTIKQTGGEQDKTSNTVENSNNAEPIGMRYILPVRAKHLIET